MGIVYNMYANESSGQQFPPMKIYNCNITATAPDNYARDCTFDGPSLFPEYLTDASVCACPSDSDFASVVKGFHQDNDLSKPVEPCRLARGSYYYVGWAMNVQSVVNPGAVVPTDPSTLDTNSASTFITFLNPDLVTAAFPIIQRGYFTPEEKTSDLGPLPRLRMGIERFFITDINNPAASAVAASGLPIMWDEIAYNGKPQGFNHVPGGGNVLYMDGHAEFQRWPTKFPADSLGMLLTYLF
jgi:prepilin-type processing-associated H-X9-DG protein